MEENKYWLFFWSIIATLIIIVVGLIGYIKYNDRMQDLVLVKSELQPYTIERCTAISIRTEWHEKGWKSND